MTIIEQRFLRAPTAHSGANCLHTVLDLGPLQYAASGDRASFADAALALLPGLGMHADALQRGCLLAEVLAWATLEVQALSGCPAPVPLVSVTLERGTRLRIIVAAQSSACAAHAFALALIMVRDLYAGCARPLADYLRGRYERALNQSAVAGSAAKNVSIRNSCKVTSRGVPSVEMAVNKLSATPSLRMQTGKNGNP